MVGVNVAKEKEQKMENDTIDFFSDWEYDLAPEFGFDDGQGYPTDDDRYDDDR